jgi:hypothetical protein
MNCGDEEIVTVDIDTSEHLAMSENSYPRQEVKYMAYQILANCHFGSFRQGP